jgi:predicted phosphodiesterase
VILGFLSDAHGNREAFELGLSVLQRKGAETVYFLGDAVGYLPGTGVIDAIQESSVGAISGNHDAMLVSGVVDAAKDAVFQHAQTNRAMTEEQRAFLATWPERRELDSPRGRLLLVHGSPLDPLNGYVYPDTDLGPFASTAHAAIFMGQTHRPFIREVNGTLFVNVGSCGLPRDCGNLGSVCLFDDAVGTATIIRFNIESATASALRRCGPVAPDVLAIYHRRAPDGCFGERE